MSPEISSDDARVKWTTYIVILILCGLLGAWWWSNNQKLEEAVSLDVEESSSSQQESTLANSSSSEILADSEPVANNTTTGGAEPEADSEPAMGIIEKEAEALDQAQVIAAGQGETRSEEAAVENIAQVQQEQSNPDPVVEESNTEIEPATVETVEPPQAVEAVNAGTDTINLIINADTWADIQDANGNRLAYDLLRADRELTLTGQAPFTAFFGNGHGVEVRFNGEEVDVLSAIRSDNTARLKIGSE